MAEVLTVFSTLYQAKRSDSHGIVSHLLSRLDQKDISNNTGLDTQPFRQDASLTSVNYKTVS